jgi:Flp pilus assembly protein TadG
MKMRLRAKSISKKGFGQGMVEFALILPLLLLLVYGVIEAGRLLFIYSAVFTSSREGARYGSASGDVGGGVPHYLDCNGIMNAVKRVAILAGVQNSDIQIQYDHGPNTGVPFSSCPSTQPLMLDDRIIVSVTAYYSPIVPLVNFPPIQINSHTARTILKDLDILGTPPAPYPTATNTPRPPTNTPLPPTNTPLPPTDTFTPTPTATNTGAPTATPTNTPTPTPTNTPTPTPTNTSTPSPTPACTLRSDSLSFGQTVINVNGTLTWQIQNMGNTPVTLQTLYIQWPYNSPKLRLNEVDMNSQSIWNKYAEDLICPPGTVCASLPAPPSSWSGFPSDRKINPGQTATVVVVFSRQLEVGVYDMRAGFDSQSGVGCPSLTVSGQVSTQSGP